MRRVCIKILIPIHFGVLKRSSSIREVLIFRENWIEANSENAVAKCIKFVTTKRGWCTTYKTVTTVIIIFSFVLFIPLGKLKCHFLHSERSSECIDFTTMYVFCLCRRLLVQWTCFDSHHSALFLVTNWTYLNLPHGHIMVTFSMTGYTWHILYSRVFTYFLPFSFLFFKSSVYYHIFENFCFSNFNL